MGSGAEEATGRPRRMLVVHAHPDDETLATGVLIARRALEGQEVHVLTCTLGDEGEIIPEELAHLAANRDDALGRYRRDELERAVAALGASVHVLGEDELGRGNSRYRDSGMAGTESVNDPRVLAQAPMRQVAGDIAAHILALRPDIVVTYDERGGYGHPDHVRVHHAVCAAISGLPDDERPPLWAVVTPHGEAVNDRAWAAAHAPRGRGLSFLLEDAPLPTGVVPDDAVPWRVAGPPEAWDRRDAALREHATQAVVGEGWYALSNRIVSRLVLAEWFAPMDPETGHLLKVSPEDLDPATAP